MKAKCLISSLAGCIGDLSGCGGKASSKESAGFDWFLVATAPEINSLFQITDNGPKVAMKAESFIKTAVASLCALMAGCGIGTNKDAAEFKWHATDSAPKHYPMEIRQGTFLYHDKSGGLYTYWGNIT